MYIYDYIDFFSIQKHTHIHTHTIICLFVGSQPPKIYVFKVEQQSFQLSKFCSDNFKPNPK